MFYPECKPRQKKISFHMQDCWKNCLKALKFYLTNEMLIDNIVLTFIITLFQQLLNTPANFRFK